MLEKDQYQNKEIRKEDSDFRPRFKTRYKQNPDGSISIAGTTPIDKKRKFSFPVSGVLIEADSLEEAVRKYNSGDYKK